MSAIQTVSFHDMSLSAIMVNGVPHVAIRPICDSLGLRWGGQYNRIKRDPALNSVVSIMKTTGADGKQYRMVLLPLDKLNGRLFGVDVARVREDLRERMNWYRAECYAVLARHFGLNGPIHPGDDLRSRLIAAEKEEAHSLAVARACSKGMNRRRAEKPMLQQRIESLREEVQHALPLEHAR